MDKCRMTSRDLVQDNIEAIGKLFPSCLREVRNKDGALEHQIDFDALKQELSRSVIEGRPERYEFNWPGKRAAALLANTPIQATLRPCREESVNFDTTENLYIEGDNLDVLKLLCDNYRGKIKMMECIAYNQIEQKFESTIFTSPTTKRPLSEAEKVEKGIQPYIFVDGASTESVERKFARELEAATEVCVYAKLPNGRKGFFIPTPVGDYSPDWAIAFNDGTVKHIYFIAETKGSLTSLDLRRIEEIKIECARKIFNQLSLTQVRYDVVKDYHSLLEAINNLKE